MEFPDAQEKRIRFGCGFVLGLVLAASGAFVVVFENVYYFVALSLISGLVCGLGAMKYGDEFWHRL